MKNIKALFTVLFCFAIICVISVSELLYCAHSTLMSPSHFAKFLDKDRNISELTELVYSSLEEPITQDSSQAVYKYAVIILNKLDPGFVKGQIYIMAVGLQKYITSETTTLPTLDFAPLNTVIKETLISDVMKQPKTTENINKVKSVLSVISNKYFSAVIKYGLSNQLVAMLLKLDPIKDTGFNGSTLSEIVEIYLSLSNKNTTLDQASYSIVLKLVEKGLELDQLKVYFDMDLFLEKTYSSDNPVLAVKVFVNSADASISLTVKILFWCLILLILINLRFNLIKFLRLILYCISMATIFNLLVSVLLINPNFSRQLISPFSVPQNSFGGFWIKLCIFLFKDMGLNLVLQSVIISIIAVISYLIITSLLKRSTKTEISNNKPSVNISLVSRSAIILVAIIMFFGWWNFYSINKDIKVLQDNMQRLSNIDMREHITNGLKEAGGMEFLEYLQKK